MREPHPLRGRWWLPEHEDHRVYGTLTWDPEEGGTLHLHDELRPVVWLDNVLEDGSIQRYRADRGDIRRTYPVVFGRVEDRAITLLDSFRLKAREYDEDERSEKVHVNRFLDGAWFNDPDELRVDRLVIDMRHLTGWVDHSGLDIEWPHVTGTDPEVFGAITASTLPTFETDQGGLGIRVFARLASTGDGVHDLGFTQQWSLRLTRMEPQPLDTFLDAASDIQDLVSVAVGKTAQFEKVVLQHPDVPLTTIAGTPVRDLRDDITYYLRWANRSGHLEPVKRHDMYFTFDDQGGMDGVKRWLKVAADYRTELARVMASQFRDGMFLEDRIMNVSAALDSFDMHRRATGKWTKYGERVEQCVALAGQPFLDLIEADTEQWVQRVVEARDDLAHHRQRFRDEGTVGDLLLAEQLFWLFTLCLLRLAEAPEAVYASITRHRHFRWLKEQGEDRRE